MKDAIKLFSKNADRPDNRLAAQDAMAIYNSE